MALSCDPDPGAWQSGLLLLFFILHLGSDHLLFLLPSRVYRCHQAVHAHFSNLDVQSKRVGKESQGLTPHLPPEPLALPKIQQSKG